MKKADLVIVAGILILAAVLHLLFSAGYRNDGADLTVEVFAGGALYRTEPLSGEARDIVVKGSDGVNVVRLEEGAVFMLEADCPGLLCVSQGPISHSGQSIACLPNRVLVVLTGDRERGDVDVVVG